MLRLASVVAGLGLALALAPAASASDLHFQLRIRNSGSSADFRGRMIGNCQLLESSGWTLPETTTRYMYSDAAGPAIGTLDVKARRGAAYVRSGGLQIEQLFRESNPNVIRFADLGVELQGRTMYLVGRLTRGVSQTAAVKRVRLAFARPVTYATGPLLDARNKPVPSTFSFIIKGQIKMLPAMVRAFEKTRCKGARQAGSRPWKPGMLIGDLEVNVRPDAAVGLKGTAKMAADFIDSGSRAPVAVEPTGGLTANSDGTFAFGLTGPIPLACLAGADCIPGSGTIAVGGFDLVFNGQRASVTNLVLSSARTGTDSVTQTLSGTLAGAPVDVISASRRLTSRQQAPPSVTEDFMQRASTALGTPIDGEVEFGFSFTETGPA
jgi:hypothetical protein